MSTLKQSEVFRCFDDCKQEGCPSHDMRVEIQNTSENLSVYVDDKFWFGGDPSQWKTLKDILERINYSYFL